MFSGKSEELIRRVRQAKFGNLSVHVFKPAIDDRYSEEEVVTHNGSTIIARPVKYSRDILEQVEKTVDVVGIDEVQFFDPDIVEVANELADRGIRVILAVLDTDFRGVPFGHMTKYMAISDKDTNLNIILSYCSTTT